MRVPTITEMIRDYVERSIYTGKFKPGSKITEAKVATALNISRPPIRETFKLLEAEGLIERIPRRGVFVTQINEHDAWEIYTLKAELYVFSITLAFDRLSASDISRMGRLVDAMEECVRSDPVRILAYQELNTNFHDVPIEVSGHQRVKRMLQKLHDQMRYFSHQTLSDCGHMQRSCEYHRKIYEAFRDGDLEETIKLTREHVMAALKAFNARFVQAGDPQGRSWSASPDLVEANG